MNISLRQLRVLVAVSRHGGFTAAADALGLTQSSVSIAIRKMEQQLNAKLFDRDTRNVQPTGLGASLAATIGRLLDELDDTLSIAESLAARQRGHVRIVAVPSVAARLIPACVAESRRLHPEITLRIDDLSAGEVTAAVIAGDVDFGILGDSEATDALCRTHLSHDPLCLVCRRDDPLARREAPTWKDLDGRDAVMLDTSTGSRALIDATLARTGVSLNEVQEMSRPEAVIGMVAAGIGIAVMPELSAPDSEHPILCVRLLSAPEVQRRIVLVHGPKNPPKDAAAAVWSIFRRRYGDGEQL